MLRMSLEDPDFLRRVRRAIHKRPEFAHAEIRTAAFVERLLVRFGLTPFRPAPTSVAVTVGSGTDRPRLGFRADLDALRLVEAPRPHASRDVGLAHACGHDGHTALLLALARRLAARPPRDGRVLLVWQQGEEADPSGAPMVLAGLPEAVMPPEMFAFHLWPELPLGTVGVRAGPVLASVAGLVITVRGSEGRPHGKFCDRSGVDALRAGVRVFAGVADRWSSRHPSLEQPATVTIGQLNGGEVPNRPPTRCVLQGTVRALSWAAEKDAIAAVQAIADSVAADTRADIAVTCRSGIRPPVINDAGSVARLVSAAQAAGVRWRDHPDEPVGVSEDFGWFIDGRPGALVFLGCGTPEMSADLHSPAFDFDEAALIPALELAEQLIRR